MISSILKELADGLDRLGRRGVDDIGRAESFGLIQSFRLDINNNDPRRTSEECPADGIESDPSGTGDNDRIAPALTFAVFNTEPAPVTPPQPSSAACGNGISLGTAASW